MRPTLLFALSSWILCVASAQTIRWDPPGGSLAVGQTSPLQLVCQDCEPKDVPVPPRVPGLRLEYAGPSTELSFENGVTTRSIKYTFAALLLDSEPVDIPAFTVQTDRGPVEVPAVHYAPTAAVVGSSGRSLDSVARSRLQPAATAVWAGQVFDLRYAVEADASYYPDVGRSGQFEWNPDPLITEDWIGPEPFHRQSGDTTWDGFGYETRALAPAPGTYTLHPARQILHLAVGMFGFFQRQYDQFSVTSDSPTIEVKALPPAPAGFDGAVGQFHLESKLVPATASVGDPVTWTLRLTGTGNWPQIQTLPQRSVSTDFKVIRPQTKRTPAPGKIFDAALSEDAVLVPMRAGRYTLPAVRFVYFDPDRGAYRTTETSPAELVVTPAPAAGVAGMAAAGGGPTPPPLLVAPEAPSGLPGDPLPTGQSSFRPMDALAVVLAAVPAAVVPLLVWLALALRHARAADPRRAERDARRRLGVIIGRIQAAGPGADGAIRPDLLEWQRESARLWALRAAVPRPADFGDPGWQQLWSDVENTLYGAGRSLPPDWAPRAARSLEQRAIPRFSAGEAFRLRHFFPFLALFLAALAPAHGDAPMDAYLRGDFKVAEAGWRAGGSADAAGRYDLSLALAQERRWPEALGEAAAAFVQRPNDPAIRRQFILACDKAGVSPGPLAPFVSPTLPYRIASSASPAVWQRRFLGSLWVAGASCVAILLALYAVVPARRGIAAASAGVFVIALAGAAGAALGWQAYGPAADAHAAFLWRSGSLRSIPTEADTRQETAPVSAGLIGSADRTFLGWVRLTFPNGQTGWVRRSDVVPLW